MRRGQEAPPPSASPAPDLHGSRRTRSRPSSPFASSPHSDDGTPRIYVAGASSPMESPACSGSPGRLTRLLHRAARSRVRKELQPALDTFCTAAAPSRLEPAGSSDARPEPPRPYFAAAVQALPLGTGLTQWVMTAPPLRPDLDDALASVHYRPKNVSILQLPMMSSINDDADQMFNYSPSIASTQSQMFCISLSFLRKKQYLEKQITCFIAVKY